jgi:hypothetical protein
MKYIKKFEEIDQDKKDEPQIGDYVICNDKYTDDKADVNIFIRTNIGQIIPMNNEDEKIENDHFDYLVKYENIPHIFVDHFFDFCNKSARPMKREEIIYYSPNKADLEIIITQNKYNL